MTHSTICCMVFVANIAVEQKIIVATIMLALFILTCF